MGNSITIANVVVYAPGSEDRHQEHYPADGIEHPSEHGNGYSRTARWHGPQMFETVRMKDGKVIGRGTYEVSAEAPR
jgi:hypothetical protein